MVENFKLLSSTLVVAYLNLSNFQVAGQTSPTNYADFECNVCLKEVHFGGTANSVYITIHDDETGEPFMAPHYTVDCGSNVPTNSLPVGYVSNTRAKVKAVIETDCDKDIFVRGTASYTQTNGTSTTLTFAEQKCIRAGSKHIYDFKSADTRFEKGVVRYLSKFEINWEYRYDQNSDWKSIGVSSNKIYVTYKKPVLATRIDHEEPTKVFHTLIDIGCRKADKLKDPEIIVDKAFEEFEDKIVNRVDGVGPMRYWGTWPDIGPDAVWYTSNMLKASILNSRCGGWAPFFENVLCIQGITSSKIVAPTAGETWLHPVNGKKNVMSATDFAIMKAEISAFVDPTKYSIYGIENDDLPTAVPNFLVKDWNLLASDKIIVAEFNNRSIFGYPILELPIGNMGQIVPIREANGVEGQGNDDPRSEFDNHAIVEYKDKIYDPSYGTKFPNRLAWESSSIVAYTGLFGVRWSEMGVVKHLILHWVKKLDDPTKLDLRYD
jgi:hypothetical protein